MSEKVDIDALEKWFLQFSDLNTDDEDSLAAATLIAMRFPEIAAELRTLRAKVAERADWVCPETYDLTLQAVKAEAKRSNDLAEELRALKIRVEAAPVGKVIEVGYDEEGQPRVIVHSTREELRDGPPIYAKRVRLVEE
jgi:hypothetical protein